jgi:CheY-like chemotaxis protein
MTKSKKLLIIDDDPEDCDFFCEAVAEIDGTYKCSQAHCAEDGLSQLRNNPSELPDYIFLDLNMPGMNGKECLNELKNDRILNSIPVIIYSTSSSAADRDETLSSGASYFLTKPSEFRTICAEINRIMQQEFVARPATF